MNQNISLDKLSKITPKPFPANWEIRSTDDNIPLGLSLVDSQTGELIDNNISFHDEGNGIWSAYIPDEKDPSNKIKHYFYFDYIQVTSENPNRESAQYYPERIHLGTIQNLHVIES